MRKAIIAASALLLLAGCSLTDVSTDQEQMTEEKAEAGKKNGPAKGIHIIPQPTNSQLWQY